MFTLNIFVSKNGMAKIKEKRRFTYTAHYYRPQCSCSKVMFLNLSDSVHSGVWAEVPPGRHPMPIRQTPPWAETPLPGDGHCSGRYASYWNTFLLLVNISSINNPIILMSSNELCWFLSHCISEERFTGRGSIAAAVTWSNSITVIRREGLQQPCRIQQAGQSPAVSSRVGMITTDMYIWGNHYSRLVTTIYTSIILSTPSQYQDTS